MATRKVKRKKVARKKVARKKVAASKKRHTAKKRVVRKKVARKKVARKKVARKKVARKKVVRKKVARKKVTRTKKRRLKGVSTVAKRKRTRKAKSPSKRRRRNPFAGKQTIVSNMMDIGIATGGAIGVSMIAPRILPKLDPRIKSGAILAISLFGSTMKFAKNKMIQKALFGMGVAAALGLTRSFVPQIPMMGEDDYYLPEYDESAGLLGEYSDEDYDDEDLMGIPEDLEGEPVEVMGQAWDM